MIKKMTDLEKTEDQALEFVKRAAIRWEVHSRTIKGWIEKGDQANDPPPLLGGDPGEFLNWYRVHIGRAPSSKVLDRADVLRRELGLADAPEVQIDLGPVELIERALARLGMPLTLARVVEEEEKAHASYLEVTAQGRNADSARKRWRDAAEMKRASQKGEDCLAVAVEILKEWVRKEWEPKEKAIREGLSGVKLGRSARTELMETKTSKEWERVWDRWIEKALERKEKDD